MKNVKKNFFTLEEGATKRFFAGGEIRLFCRLWCRFLLIERKNHWFTKNVPQVSVSISRLNIKIKKFLFFLAQLQLEPRAGADQKQLGSSPVLCQLAGEACLSTYYSYHLGSPMVWSMVGERGILLLARWWLDPPPPTTEGSF